MPSLVGSEMCIRDRRYPYPDTIYLLPGAGIYVHQADRRRGSRRVPIHGSDPRCHLRGGRPLTALPDRDVRESSPGTVSCRRRRSSSCSGKRSVIGPRVSRWNGTSTLPGLARLLPFLAPESGGGGSGQASTSGLVRKPKGRLVLVDLAGLATFFHASNIS